MTACQCPASGTFPKMMVVSAIMSYYCCELSPLGRARLNAGDPAGIGQRDAVAARLQHQKSAQQSFILHGGHRSWDSDGPTR